MAIVSLAACLNGPSCSLPGQCRSCLKMPIIVLNVVLKQGRREKKGDELAGASGIKKKKMWQWQRFPSQLQKRSRWEVFKEAGLMASSICRESLAHDAFSSAFTLNVPIVLHTVHGTEAEQNRDESKDCGLKGSL